MSIKPYVFAFAALVILSCLSEQKSNVVVAQVATGINFAETPNEILSDYLAYLPDSQSSDKADLRAQLLDLGSDELMEVLRNHVPSDNGKRGVFKIETLCPDGITRHYMLDIPKTYDPKRSYPVMVRMHGAVNYFMHKRSKADFNYFRKRVPDDWKEDIIILGPSAYVPQHGKESCWWHPTGGMQNVLHMIRDAKRHFNIDDDRVFIGGMSDGGNGSYALATRRPDTFAGYFPFVAHPLIPMLAGNCMQWFPNLKDAKIYHVSGGKDKTYPGKEVSEHIERANAQGASIINQFYPEAGHDHSFHPVEIPKILHEMVSVWQRDLLPMSIDWTTDMPETGRKAWLEISKLHDLQDSNADIEPTLAAPTRVTLGIDLDRGNKDTCIVTTVVKKSTAAKMGIKTGDNIVELAGLKVRSYRYLGEVLFDVPHSEPVTCVVVRNGDRVELTGTFEKPKQLDLFTARAIAERSVDMPGHINVDVYNVGTLRIWVAPEMLDSNGAIHISINGEAALSTQVEADPELIFSEFERTADRKRPFIAAVDIDIAELLGK